MPRSYACKVSANDGTGRCVQWTQFNPFPQVIGGTFAALSDTASLSYQVKWLK